MLIFALSFVCDEQVKRISISNTVQYYKTY